MAQRRMRRNTNKLPVFHSYSLILFPVSDINIKPDSRSTEKYDQIMWAVKNDRNHACLNRLLLDTARLLRYTDP